MDGLIVAGCVLHLRAERDLWAIKRWQRHAVSGDVRLVCCGVVWFIIKECARFRSWGMMLLVCRGGLLIGGSFLFEIYDCFEMRSVWSLMGLRLMEIDLVGGIESVLEMEGMCGVVDGLRVEVNGSLGRCRSQLGILISRRQVCRVISKCLWNMMNAAVEGHSF